MTEPTLFILDYFPKAEKFIPPSQVSQEVFCKERQEPRTKNQVTTHRFRKKLFAKAIRSISVFPVSVTTAFNCSGV